MSAKQQSDSGNTLRGMNPPPDDDAPPSSGTKAGSGNTLRGMNPPPNDDAPPSSGTKGTSGDTLRDMDPPPQPDAEPEPDPKRPGLHAEEFYPPDWQSLTTDEMERLKEGKPLKAAPAPLAGAHRIEAPVDPTAIEAPRKATDYAEPRALRPVTDHKTIETETIKVDPAIDPRRATTERKLRKPPPEAASESTDPDATLVNADTTIPGAPERSAWGRFGVVALVCVGVVVLGIAWSKKSDDASNAATTQAATATATATATARAVKPTAEPVPERSTPVIASGDQSAEASTSAVVKAPAARPAAGASAAVKVPLKRESSTSPKAKPNLPAAPKLSPTAKTTAVDPTPVPPQKDPQRPVF